MKKKELSLAKKKYNKPRRALRSTWDCGLMIANLRLNNPKSEIRNPQLNMPQSGRWLLVYGAWCMVREEI